MVNLALQIDFIQSYTVVVRNEKHEQTVQLHCAYNEIKKILIEQLNGVDANNQFNPLTFYVDGLLTYCIIKGNNERSNDASIRYHINRLSTKGD